VAGEGVYFLAVNQDFEPADLGDVGFEGFGDGVYGHLFALDSGGSRGGHRFGEVGDGGAVGEHVEGEEHGVGWKGAELGVDRAGEQGVEDLLGARCGIHRERQLDADGHKRAVARARGPEEFCFCDGAGGVCRCWRNEFAARLLFADGLDFFGLAQTALEDGQVESGDENGDREHGDQVGAPTRVHGRSPGFTAATT
jgi:hypothetical protein